MIGRLVSMLRTRAAQRRLDRIVRATRESYPVTRYRERRAAALKATRGGSR